MKNHFKKVLGIVLAATMMLSTAIVLDKVNPTEVVSSAEGYHLMSTKMLINSTITPVPSKTTAAVGEQITVDFMVSKGSELKAFTFNVHYPRSILRFESAVGCKPFEAEGQTTGMEVVSTPDEEGRGKLSYHGEGGPGDALLKNTCILKATFTVIAEGEATIHPVCTYFVGFYNTVNLEGVDATINKSSSVVTTTANSSTVTNTSSTYINSSKYYDPSKKGDVDGDKNLNIADVQALLGLVQKGKAGDLAVTDINNDKKVDIIDVNLLLGMVLSVQS